MIQLASMAKVTKHLPICCITLVSRGRKLPWKLQEPEIHRFLSIMLRGIRLEVRYFFLLFDLTNLRIHVTHFLIFFS